MAFVVKFGEPGHCTGLAANFPQLLECSTARGKPRRFRPMSHWADRCGF
jgi:hypothetical protein